MSYLKLTFLLSIVFIFIACGGGGSGGTPTEAQVLVDGQTYNINNNLIVNDAQPSTTLTMDSSHYYSFDVTKDQKYTITLKSHASGDSDIAVFNNNELTTSSLVGLSILPTSPDIVEFIAPENKTYFLEIYNHSDGDYTLLIETTPRKLADGVEYSTRGRSVSEIIVEDMNGDSLDDIVYLTNIDVGDIQTGQEIAIFYQQNNGTLIKGFLRDIPFSGHEYELLDIAVGDMNNDGGKDLIIATKGRNDLYYLHVHLQNIATKSIDNSFTEYPAAFMLEVAVADINADNRDDVLGLNNGNLLYYTQNNAGTLNPFVLNNTAQANTSYKTILKTLDVSNDGDMDILYDKAGLDSAILINEPAGSLIREVTLNGSAKYASDINTYNAGDLNGDLLTDVVFLERESSFGLMNIFMQNSSGEFVKSVSDTPIPDSRVCDFVITDITGDSLPDIVAYGVYSGDVWVSRQLNNLAFKEASRYSGYTDGLVSATCNLSERLAVGDLNNDGYTDVVVGKAINEGGIYILINQPG